MNEGRRMLMRTKSVDDYLTFTALENGAFTLKIGEYVNTDSLASVAYSLDNGVTWVTTDNVDYSTVTITTPTVVVGSTVKWKGTGAAYATDSMEYISSSFSATGRFSVSGNIMSLLFGDNYEEENEISNNYAFCNLFKNSKVTDASKLLLPATTLTNYCYYYMFRDCTSLTTAPEILPATTLKHSCYYGMFNGCTSLTNAPKLPATTLIAYCYYNMFYGCTSLTTAPKLLATTLAPSCYTNMFFNCNSLTIAPELPATTLVTNCYREMFRGCSSLTVAPVLPATTLASYCYYYMFANCNRLVELTCLATNISASYCTVNWLMGTAYPGNAIFKKAVGITEAEWRNNGSVTSEWTIVDAS